MRHCVSSLPIPRNRSTVSKLFQNILITCTSTMARLHATSHKLADHSTKLHPQAWRRWYHRLLGKEEASVDRGHKTLKHRLALNFLCKITMPFSAKSEDSIPDCLMPPHAVLERCFLHWFHFPLYPCFHKLLVDAEMTHTPAILLRL